MVDAVRARLPIEVLSPRAATVLARQNPCVVRGTFTGGLYLENDDGIIAVTRSEVPLTPLSARLGSGVALPRLHRGDVLPTATFDATQVRFWDPRPPWPALDVSAVLRLATSARIEAEARLQAEAPDVLARATTGLLPEALLGLGPGLTPAGDDVLVGRLLAAQARWPLGGIPASPDLAAPLLAAAENRTTRLSLAFLRAAAAGECGQAWHDLWPTPGASSGSREAAIRVILGTGQTSGAAALWGFLTAGEVGTNDASH
jgi:hypothetical protein